MFYSVYKNSLIILNSNTNKIKSYTNTINSNTRKEIIAKWRISYLLNIYLNFLYLTQIDNHLTQNNTSLTQYIRTTIFLVEIKQM